MTLRSEYAEFLRARLSLRLLELQSVFSILATNPPAVGTDVEITIFPDDGITEHVPFRVFAFTATALDVSNEGAVGMCNERLRSMVPLLTMEEYDSFQIWEGEGENRMVAMEQPTDGVEEEELKSWVARAWQGLDLQCYRCRTSIAVHDGDIEVLFSP